MPKPTATARRLSDLLQEQQEPFLQRRRCYSLAEACGRRLRSLLCDRDRRGAAASGRTSLLPCLLCGGSNAATKQALRRRGSLSGCFPCAGQRFRRLPRAGVGDVPDCCDAAMDGGSTQLSPVSVFELELRSDRDESPDHCNWGQEQDDAAKPTTTSGPSPPPPSNLGLTAAAHANAVVGTGGDQRKQRGAFSLRDKEQATVVSAWERIAADISRIPALVALDLSGSGSVAGEEEEARRLVGQSIEAMIFEEVRWEAVRDTVLLHSTALTSLPDFML